MGKLNIDSTLAKGEKVELQNILHLVFLVRNKVSRFVDDNSEAAKVDKSFRTLPVKKKFDEFQDGLFNALFSFNQSSVARVKIENKCSTPREMVSNQQQTIEELYTELDEERNASSSTTNEAMLMVLRLQRKMAEIQMEAWQFKQFTEEKMASD
ncbi:hypothetical protein NE237_005508 [Protea cynaroides]|uniref:GTD-binding domain-containing protein n=1 Tax=Protea cynaroides TaxID=273540 RepID=A0A9Q0KL00_9MAGN|nr:hypothetical protein NE237_005508 [Protea cynaroides]